MFGTLCLRKKIWHHGKYTGELECKGDINSAERKKKWQFDDLHLSWACPCHQT